tara:strand:- start:594 stop:860 length:267 start_codon:yes stop_codon:yes gene_type:complete
MKTVIVIDTDDPAGMESTRRIVKHLMETYHSMPKKTGPWSGKIAAIKTTRGYVHWCRERYGDKWQQKIGDLRSAKEYVETFDEFSPKI